MLVRRTALFDAKSDCFYKKHPELVKAASQGKLVVKGDTGYYVPLAVSDETTNPCSICDALEDCSMNMVDLCGWLDGEMDCRNRMVRISVVEIEV